MPTHSFTHNRYIIRRVICLNAWGNWTFWYRRRKQTQTWGPTRREPRRLLLGNRACTQSSALYRPSLTIVGPQQSLDCWWEWLHLIAEMPPIHKLTKPQDPPRNTISTTQEYSASTREEREDMVIYNVNMHARYAVYGKASWCNKQMRAGFIFWVCYVIAKSGILYIIATFCVLYDTCFNHLHFWHAYIEIICNHYYLLLFGDWYIYAHNVPLVKFWEMKTY
mgnify:CR=1 FL=1